VLLGGVVVAFLLHFVRAYPVHLRETGGTSHRTFRTAAVDPKRAAVDVIREAAAAEETIVVLVEDYWLEWPLRFYAGADPRFRIVNLEDTGADRSRVFEEEMRAGAFLAVHDGGAMHRALRGLFALRSDVRTWALKDYAGKPVAHVACGVAAGP
jgi:hypothetical protein